jgi:hypothetical protein
MAEPDNLILALLRELRAELDRQDKARRALETRFDNLRQAVNGESVLGRYAAAEVEGVSNKSRSGSPPWKNAAETVMAVLGLDPRISPSIHDFVHARRKAWMPGPSPA